ncbi:FAD binding domain-containing protein [Nonomuraea gerenzanensis]|uniref:Carbon monoxide dehydrogenase medium chain n=1 Tax=Nonomuraea gerenzanensis TaxID=93944 RepID=A0A1M4E8K1_9ACTN|nr:xanthine dehydrogenase family protein subunit M [Nonomuraea gerenzanensis]UBU17327.1 xanthine dehydrogenase family protein subunit M [Nonomuraea gerenzanensis]SBO95074.1 Carbon monoxide dehydrogenase medium chain [Nonomuraea gerenzanensis]
MQVPATFEYERAESVPHALELLERYGPEARVVAGGHSLIPMMKLRLAQPEALIDINGLADELGGIAVEGDELAIGAMVRHTELLESATATDLFPIFRDAERVIADPIVRNRGTVGGSLCQGDPSEDLSAVFAALRATAVIQGPGGMRTVPVRRFHQGPYETAVEPNELLIQLRVPVAAGTGSAYEKVERRVGDWPVAAAGAVLRIEGGVIARAGIGLTAVGAAHFCAPEAEAYLEGRAPDEEAFAQAGRIAAEHCEPHADQRGPADYKRHLAAELTRRALARAAGRS